MSAAAFCYEPPFHTCSCGQQYTKQQWLRLPITGGEEGLFEVPEGDGEAAYLARLRDCVMCGSSRSEPVAREEGRQP